MVPDLSQLSQELFVIVEISELAYGIRVFFEVPVRWRGYNQVDAIRFQDRCATGITKPECVIRRNTLNGLLDGTRKLRVLGNARQIGLRVVQFLDLGRQVSFQVG